MKFDSSANNRLQRSVTQQTSVLGHDTGKFGSTTNFSEKPTRLRFVFSPRTTDHLSGPTQISRRQVGG